MKSFTSAITYGLTISTCIKAAYIPASATAQGLDVSQSLQNILDNTDNNPGYTYATDLTRGIVPKNIHSHNDYWRDIPFYTALSVGCISVEADVWLENGTLFIGHEQSALTPARTFNGLYIQPILNTVQRENPSSPYVTSPTRNGVYDTSSGQTLYLFVDVKTDGPTTWPHVIQELQPLRAAGYLTVWNGTAVVPGPVTVVGTGNTPLNQIQGVSPRDYFFDAQLSQLDTVQSNITSSVSPIASTDFGAQVGAINGTTFNSTQMATIIHQIGVANSKGIMGRYWDTPGWPISTRNAVWTTLWTHGVGLVNADAVVEAAGFGGDQAFW